MTAFSTRLPNLSGKVVVLYLANRNYEHVVVMEDPIYELQGERLFLCGSIPEGVSPNDWATGIRSSVAWDHVEEYLVFESLEDYLSRAALAAEEGYLQ